MRQIIDIAPMVADFGEPVDFFTMAPGTLNRGVYTEGEFTKIPDLAAVFPLDYQELDFDTSGVKLQGAKKVFTKMYFPISNFGETPQDTRMRYSGNTYRLFGRKPYPGNYYVYYAEWLRVDPETLPE